MVVIDRYLLGLLARLMLVAGFTAPAWSGEAGPPPGDAAGVDAALAVAVRAALDGDYDAWMFTAAVDLDDDGRDEALAYTAGPMICGTGGCPLYVFTRHDDAWRLVTPVSIAQLPVRVADTKSHGWRDLVVAVRGGGAQPGHALLRFDGNRYPRNPTVAPAEPVAEPGAGRVLIPEFGALTEGTPVP